IAVPQLMAKMIREVKPLMIIKQTGDDFVVSVKTPLRTNTNSFTIGRESEFTTMDRVKTRAINGKIVIDTEKVTHMREIQGEQMIE
ncbi:fatty acid-binding protein, liver, partial [Silurus meridionalis]